MELFAFLKKYGVAGNPESYLLANRQVKANYLHMLFLVVRGLQPTATYKERS